MNVLRHAEGPEKDKVSYKVSCHHLAVTGITHLLRLCRKGDLLPLASFALALSLPAGLSLQTDAKFPGR